MTDDVLDDFTCDDLSGTVLVPLSFYGILWSPDGTRWPPGTDTDYVLACSRPVEGRTDVYRIAV